MRSGNGYERTCIYPYLKERPLVGRGGEHGPDSRQSSQPSHDPSSSSGKIVLCRCGSCFFTPLLVALLLSYSVCIFTHINMHMSRLYNYNNNLSGWSTSITPDCAPDYYNNKPLSERGVGLSASSHQTGILAKGSAD